MLFAMSSEKTIKIEDDASETIVHFAAGKDIIILHPVVEHEETPSNPSHVHVRGEWVVFRNTGFVGVSQTLLKL